MLKAVIPIVIILLVYYLIKMVCHPKYFFVNQRMELSFDYKKDFIYWIICTIVQFLTWFPLLLAYYPGLMNYDADVQVKQHMGTYSTPHPLFHTFYLKFFYNVIGEKIFNSINIGVLLATITQMILFAAMISYMHLFLKRIGLKMWGRITVLSFTGLAPFVSVMSISLVKDTLFAGLFLVVFICFCYWELDSRGYCTSKAYIITYILGVATMCLMRKNGILIIAIIMITEAFMLFNKEKRKTVSKLVIYTIIGVCIYFVLQSGAIYITKASGSSSNEVLSVPYQQMAYINNIMGNEITIEEKEALYYIIPDIERYNLRNSDPIKARARGMEDIDTFVKLYFNLACRFPIQCAEAFLHHTIGYWYVFDKSFTQYYGISSRIGYLPTLQCSITFKENCPDTRNSKVVDIINRLKEFEIEPIVTDSWADVDIAKHEYGVDLLPFADIPKADCVIVAVGHSEFRSMSMMQIKQLFKSELQDDEKVLIDVKSLYRKDELDASGMRYWRL